MFDQPIIGPDAAARVAQVADEERKATGLAVDNVTKRFAAKRGMLGGVIEWFHAVDDVSFEQAEGTTLGVVGESGSGKTTLGKCIAGLAEPSAGSIHYRGEELRAGRMDIETRLSVQMVHQATGSALDPRMKVRQVIGEGMHQMPGVSRSDIADRVTEAMEAVGLRSSDANRYPHMFSGGQKQRIVIARAIVLRPSLLVLDEPTSALDVSIQVKILNLLKALQEERGLTYVLISHDIRAVQAMADQVAVMYRGRIVEMGPTAEVIARPVHPYTQHLIASVPVADPAQRVGDDQPTVVGPAVDDGEDLSVGCPYRVRCPLAEQPCFEQRPPLLDVGQGHLVACPPGVRRVVAATEAARG